MQSCNIKRQPENPDSELRTKRLFLYCIQQHTHTFILCNSNKHVLKGFPATLKATKWALCWHHRPEVSDFLKWCSDLLLQLCLVSILGFILYFITYLPDERTSMQFICKVSLQHRHTHTHRQTLTHKSATSYSGSNQVPQCRTCPFDPSLSCSNGVIRCMSFQTDSAVLLTEMLWL